MNNEDKIVKVLKSKEIILVKSMTTGRFCLRKGDIIIGVDEVKEFAKSILKELGTLDRKSVKILLDSFRMRVGKIMIDASDKELLDKPEEAVKVLEDCEKLVED